MGQQGRTGESENRAVLGFRSCERVQTERSASSTVLSVFDVVTATPLGGGDRVWGQLLEMWGRQLFIIRGGQR